MSLLHSILKVIFLLLLLGIGGQSFAYGKPLIGNGNWKPWTEEEQYWQILGKEDDNVFDLLKPRLKITNFFYNRGD